MNGRGLSSVFQVSVTVGAGIVAGILKTLGSFGEAGSGDRPRISPVSWFYGPLTEHFPLVDYDQGKFYVRACGPQRGRGRHRRADRRRSWESGRSY